MADYSSKISLDASGFNRILDEILLKMGNLSKDLTQINKSEVSGKPLQSLNQEADKTSKSFSGIGDAVLGVTGAFAAVGGMVSTMSSFVSESIDAQTEITKLESVLKATGNQVGYTAEELSNMADAQGKAWGIDPGTINNANALLLTFTAIGHEALPRATQAAADLQAVGFGNMETNAIQLGKALQDPIKGITALAKSGVTFSEEQKQLIEGFVKTGEVAKAQEIIFQGIEQQVGGAAAAMGKTTKGDLARFNEMWAQIKESIGNVIVTVISGLAPILETIGSAIKSFADTFGGKVVIGIGLAIAAISTIGTVITLLLPALGTLTAAFSATWTAALGPVGLIIAGIVAVTAGFLILYNKVEAFRNVVDGVWSAISSLWKTDADKAKEATEEVEKRKKAEEEKVKIQKASQDELKKIAIQEQAGTKNAEDTKKAIAGVAEKYKLSTEEVTNTYNQQKKLTTEVEVTKEKVKNLADGYKQLKDSNKEALDNAKEQYAALKNSGTATKEQLALARKKIEDTAKQTAEYNKQGKEADKIANKYLEERKKVENKYSDIKSKQDKELQKLEEERIKKTLQGTIDGIAEELKAENLSVEKKIELNDKLAKAKQQQLGFTVSQVGPTEIAAIEQQAYEMAFIKNDIEYSEAIKGLEKQLKDGSITRKQFDEASAKETEIFNKKVNNDKIESLNSYLKIERENTDSSNKLIAENSKKYWNDAFTFSTDGMIAFVENARKLAENSNPFARLSNTLMNTVKGINFQDVFKGFNNSLNQSLKVNSDKKEELQKQLAEAIDSGKPIEEIDKIKQAIADLPSSTQIALDETSKLLDGLSTKFYDTAQKIIADGGSMTNAMSNVAAGFALALGSTLADSKSTWKDYVATVLDAIQQVVLLIGVEILAKEVATKSWLGVASTAALMALIIAALNVAKSSITGRLFGGLVEGETGLSGLTSPGAKLLALNENGKPEYVVNARSTAKYKDLLDAINKDDIHKFSISKAFNIPQSSLTTSNNSDIVTELKGVNLRLERVEQAQKQIYNRQAVQIEATPFKIDGNDLTAVVKKQKKIAIQGL